MGMNRSPQDYLRREQKRRLLEHFKNSAARAASLHRYKREQQRVVAAFNVRLRSRHFDAPVFYPTIRCCVDAHRFFMEVLCPACMTIGVVDLRNMNYHSETTIGALIPKLSCRSCCKHPPLARIIGIRRRLPGFPKLVSVRSGLGP